MARYMTPKTSLVIEEKIKYWFSDNTAKIE